jgi:hypothetical protein
VNDESIQVRVASAARFFEFEKLFCFLTENNRSNALGKAIVTPFQRSQDRPVAVAF